MARVYISSTYSDLVEYRKRVYDALHMIGHEVVAMEDYVATDQRPVDKCLSDVAACDLYIGIFARRYGYVPTERNPEARSITELEFREAKSNRIACLLFLLDEAAEWPASHVEEGEGSVRIRRLREELSANFIVSTFHSPDNLAALVSAAVAKWGERDSVRPPERRYRDLLLTNLESHLNSLSNHARHALPIELVVEECPELVRSPGQSDIRRVLRDGPMGIVERFNRLGSGGALLLVGEAGSGKTSAMIQLARHLLERARNGSEDRWPILLNLAAWPVKKLPFLEWLIRQLSREFELPPQYGKSWCEKFTLLLDGLDPLLDSGGAAAIQSLNEFRRRHPLNMIVVTCKKGVYASINEKLIFHAAIQLRPVSDAQIVQVVASEGSGPGRLSSALANSAGLRELATLPLWLWLMSEVYRSPGIEAAGPERLANDARRTLCDRYVDLKLGNSPASRNYPPARTRIWLAWLAQNMGGKDRPFFFQTIQPTLLSGRADKWLYTFCFSTLFGLLLAILSPASRGVWMVMGCAIGWFLSWRDIQPLERLHWHQIWLAFQMRLEPARDLARSAAEFFKGTHHQERDVGSPKVPFFVKVKTRWKELAPAILPPLRTLLSIAFVIAVLSFIGMAWQDVRQDGLASGLQSASKNALLVFIAIVVVMPPLLMLAFLLGVPLFLLTSGMMVAAFVGPFWLVATLSGPIDPTKAMTGRESTRRQIVNILLCTLLGGFSTVACIGIVIGVVDVINAFQHKAANPYPTWVADFLRFAYMGAVFGFATGLTPAIRYIVLRLILWMRGGIPFSYGRFLKYATERALLKREGRGVIFIHEYLQAYFASLPPGQHSN